MKTLIITAAAFLFVSAVGAQQTETYYILVPYDSLSQQMIGQLKAFRSTQEDRFLQDDTTSLRKVKFQQDTTQTYVVLSWVGSQAPSSIPATYEIGNSNVYQRIFTAGEIKAYINQNEYTDWLMTDE